MAFAYAGLDFIRRVGVCIGGAFWMLYCAQTKSSSKCFKKSHSGYFSVCSTIQGPIQGAMQGPVQGLANAVLTSKSVRAQWCLIIGVRICLAWS